MMERELRNSTSGQAESECDRPGPRPIILIQKSTTPSAESVHNHSERVLMNANREVVDSCCP